MAGKAARVAWRTAVTLVSMVWAEVCGVGGDRGVNGSAHTSVVDQNVGADFVNKKLGHGGGVAYVKLVRGAACFGG